MASLRLPSARVQPEPAVQATLPARDAPTEKLPAPVSFKWHVRPSSGPGLLEINGTLYLVTEQQFEHENAVGGRLWDLKKADGITYRLALNADADLACDCPHAVYRHAETTCKHVRGLMPALEELDRQERLERFLAPGGPTPDDVPF